MRAPVRRRSNVRSALDAAAIPTWTGPRMIADSAASIRFIRAPGRLPRGRRVYAIGDIHGHPAKLTALHRAIAEDFATRPTRAAVLVHLGDYIDQGPDSAGHGCAWNQGVSRRSASSTRGVETAKLRRI